METSISRSEPQFSLIQQAIEKGIDADALSKLVDLQERVQKHNAEMAFNEAMQSFQGECPVIPHDKSGGGNPAKYTYASLPQIVATIRPFLNEHGFAYSFDCVTEQDRMITTCTVSHVAGHSRTHSIMIKICGTSAMSQPQMAASALTYGRRYALCAALGIVTADTDDDCNAGAGGRPDSGVNPSPRPDPRVAPRGERTVDPEVLARHRSIGARWKAARQKQELSVSQQEFDHLVCEANGSEVAPSQTMKPQFWSEADFLAVEAAVSQLESRVAQ